MASKVRLQLVTNQFILENTKSETNSFWKENRVVKLPAPYKKNGGGVIETGLNDEEKKNIFPDLLNIKYEDPSFRKTVHEYYTSNFSIDIPYTGRDLEIGLDSQGYPINPIDFLMFKAAMVHPRIAKSVKELSPAHYAYLMVEEDIQAAEIDFINKKKEASRIFIQLTDKEYSMYLYLLKQREVSEVMQLNINKLNKNTKEIILDGLKDKYPQDFIEIKKDQYAQEKFMIEKAVTNGIFIRKGNTYIYQNETIGSIDDVITWMKDAQNTQELEVIKAQLNK